MRCLRTPAAFVAAACVAVLSLVACGKSRQGPPSKDPKPARGTEPASRVCLSAYLTPSEIQQSLEQARRLRRLLPKEDEAAWTASALTQSIAERIGLRRTNELMDSGLLVPWQLEMIKNYLPVRPDDYCIDR